MSDKGDDFLKNLLDRQRRLTSARHTAEKKLQEAQEQIHIISRTQDEVSEIISDFKAQHQKPGKEGE